MELALKKSHSLSLGLWKSSLEIQLLFRGKPSHMKISGTFADSCIWVPTPLSDPTVSASLLKIYFILFLAVLGPCHCAGFSVAAASRGSSPLQRAGFSLWWHLLLWNTASTHGACSSCGMWAQQLRLPDSRSQAQSLCSGSAALWHVGSPQTGDCTPSLAGAGGFFTTEPSGKPRGASLDSKDTSQLS